MLVQEICFLRVLNLQSKSLLNGKKGQIGQKLIQRRNIAV